MLKDIYRTDLHGINAVLIDEKRWFGYYKLQRCHEAGKGKSAQEHKAKVKRVLSLRKDFFTAKFTKSTKFLINKK